MELIETYLKNIADIVWGYPLIVLLLGTHIFLTIRLRLIQRYIPLAIRLSVRSTKKEEGEISHFGALSTALAATIGTGNIVGVATAISVGGPGAVFWMWITGVFGFATKYTEAVLSIRFRTRNDRGEIVGGPMYVLERGMNIKWLAILFAIFTIIASFGIGNMVQSNAVAHTIEENFSFTKVKLVTGIIIALLTGIVIIGGIKSIARVCEFLVPFMAIVYCLGCTLIILLNYQNIPESIMLIFKTAFTGQSAVGGFVGAGVKEAIRFGVSRGLFSNEAGLGSAPIVAAAAKTQYPAEQGFVSATGTFWDTVVICFLTGLTLICSGAWTVSNSPIGMVQLAWNQLSSMGPIMLTISLVMFVYSTILGWYYYGEKAWEYLFSTRAILMYRIMWVLAVFIGSQIKLDLVWLSADIANAFMSIPNLISLLVLSSIVVNETHQYFEEIQNKS